MNNKKNVLLYGASGHCKIICSILESMNIPILGVFDDNLFSNTANYLHFIGAYNPNYKPDSLLIISIGSNKLRKQISTIIKHQFAIGIHRSAIIDKIVTLGEGTVIMHNTVIQRDVLIGRHCIINTNASVDHDCVINDFVHISPSVTLCGNVKVGEGTHIGAGATVIPNISIGKWCMIGAGAVITKDVPDFSFVVGVPGKILKTLKNE
jgi:sugar O-acyltransferase (sialic acid O-acetyltransferase NeuD family)